METDFFGKRLSGVNLPSILPRFLLLAAFLTPFFWIFREAVFTSRAFVFRDAAHYYQPLFAWASGEWGQGRVPLWNPYDNGGAPAVADPTTSAFYPGKLIFALPLGYATRYKVYLLTHVLLAGGAAGFVARRWGATPAAAAACGLSYAYGGSVVFHYCNAVYLVGAAWLPLAVWTSEGVLRHRRATWAVGLGGVLAMMVLGGDPQTAYHAGLVAVLGLAVSWRRVHRNQAPSSADKRSPPLPSPAPRRKSLMRNRLVLLAAAAGVAGMLAAVQVLPAMRGTQRSHRTSFSAPRSLYEIPKYLARDDGSPDWSVAQGLFGPPATGTHHAHVYDFSVGPWRWAEFVWPNFSGRMFPIHRRWTAAIPAEGRVWTPSLYLGLAPLIAALAALRWRGGSWRVRWLSWTAVLALVAALGWYGLGWLWLELRQALFGAAPESSAVGGPTGGLYWLLVQVLPGYVNFRYPAKWLTVAALALSLLTAQGWDAAFSGRSRRARRATFIIGLLSLVGMVTWMAIRPFWNGWMQAVPADSLLGPLDADGAARDLLLALLHTSVLAVLLFVLMRRGAKTGALVPSAVLAMLLTAADLAVAHGWLAPTAPREMWERTPRATAAIAADAASPSRASGFRVYRGSSQRWSPDSWRLDASPRRQIEGLHWDHATLFPRYHLTAKTPLVGTPGALVAADFHTFFNVARAHGFRRADGVAEPAPEALALLGAAYALLPHDAKLPGGTPVARSLGPGDLANTALWRNSPALPRAWIVDRVVRRPELEEDSPRALARRTREVFFVDGRWRDFQHEAVIETNADVSAITDAAGDSSRPATCQLVVEEPQRLEVEVSLPTPRLLVMSDFYDDDWQAYYQPHGSAAARPLPLWRANRILRGVWVPAGDGRVVLVYRPPMFYLGATISAVAWLAGLAWVLRRHWPRPRSRAVEPREI